MCGGAGVRVCGCAGVQVLCVCVCGVAEYPAATIYHAGKCGMTEGPHSTKLPQSWDIGSDQSDVPATFGVGAVKSFWPVVSLAVCSSC